MKRKRFTEVQIIGVLKEHEAGAKVDDLFRRYGINTATFYAWRQIDVIFEAATPMSAKPLSPALERGFTAARKIFQCWIYEGIADEIMWRRDVAALKISR